MLTLPEYFCLHWDAPGYNQPSLITLRLLASDLAVSSKLWERQFDKARVSMKEEAIARSSLPYDLLKY
jgi:hypothetical protein